MTEQEELQELQELEELALLEELEAKSSGGYQEYPGREEYRKQLVDKNSSLNPFNDDLSDIRYVVNLLTTGNIADLPAMAVGLGDNTKIANSRADAETAGTAILNDKLGLPGRVGYDNKTDKFYIYAQVFDENNNLVENKFSLDQSDNIVESILTKAYAASGELAQEGPRVAGALVGLGFLLASSAAAGVESATGVASPAAPATVMGGLGLDYGSNYVGNYVSEKIARGTFDDATGKKYLPRVGSPALEAGFTTATDPVVGSVLGRGINATAKLGGKVAKAVGTTFADNLTRALPLLDPVNYVAIKEGLDTLDNWGGFLQKQAVNAGEKIADTIAKTSKVVSDIQMPIVKGVSKQIQKLTLPASSGTAGSTAALLANLNKATFSNEAFMNSNSIEELIKQSKTDVNGFLENINTINKDPELRNVYQSQLRVYVNKLLKDIKSGLNESILQNKTTRKIKAGTIKQGAEEAIEKGTKEIDLNIENTVSKIEGLQEQAKQATGQVDILKSELDTYNKQIADIDNYKKGLKQDVQTTYSNTATGVPKEEAGMGIKKQLFDQNKAVSNERRNIYQQAESLNYGNKLSNEQLEDLQSIIDPVVNESGGNFEFEKFDSGVAGGKVRNLFSPIGQFDKEGQFIYKQGITEKDIANLKSNLSSVYGSDLNPTQISTLTQTNKNIDNMIVEPAKREGSEYFTKKAEGDIAYQVENIKYNEGTTNKLYGEGTKEVTGEVAEKLGAKEGDLVLGNTGVQTYDNFLKLMDEDPRKATEYFKSLTPELQDQVRQIEKLDLMDGVADRKIGKDKILGTDTFDLPEQRVALESSVADTTSRLNDTESYIEKLRKEVSGLENQNTTFSNTRNELPSQVATEAREASSLIDSTDPSNLTNRQFEAQKQLEARGIDSSAITDIDGQVASNIQNRSYQDALSDLESSSVNNQKYVGDMNLDEFSKLNNFTNKISEAGYDSPALADLSDVLGLDVAFTSQPGKVEEFIFNRPEMMRNLGDNQASQVAESALNSGKMPHSHLSDLARVMGSLAGYGASGSAAVGNLTGAGVSSGTRGFLSGAFDGLGRGLQKFKSGLAAQPTIPLIDRLPVDNVMYQGVDQLPPDFDVFNEDTVYSPRMDSPVYNGVKYGNQMMNMLYGGAR